MRRLGLLHLPVLGLGRARRSRDARRRRRWGELRELHDGHLDRRPRVLVSHEAHNHEAESLGSESFTAVCVGISDAESCTHSQRGDPHEHKAGEWHGAVVLERRDARVQPVRQAAALVKVLRDRAPIPRHRDAGKHKRRHPQHVGEERGESRARLDMCDHETGVRYIRTTMFGSRSPHLEMKKHAAMYATTAAPIIGPKCADMMISAH